MKLRVSGFANDSIVDGVGIRLTVFTQGCPHNCPGCHNPHTHSYNGGSLYEVDDIVEMFKKNPLLSGITLSGGDPFEQPEACAELAEKIHNLNKSVWCYTGYIYENLLSSHRADYLSLLNNIDVLVDGPFVESLKSPEIRFVGSSNQRIINVPESLHSGTVVELH